MQTRDEVNNDFPNLSSVYIRLGYMQTHEIEFSIAFVKELSREKNKTLLFRALIKREILTSLAVLYTKLVRVISPCFAEKMLSKIGFFSFKMSAQDNRIDTACF